MSIARTIAWVSVHDQRGYTRLHEVLVKDEEAATPMMTLWEERKITRTRCGVNLPAWVTDVSEHTKTLRCNRCFPRSSA